VSERASTQDASRRPFGGQPAPATFRHGEPRYETVEGGIGHNLPQEAHPVCAETITDVDRFRRRIPSLSEISMYPQTLDVSQPTATTDRKPAGQIAFDGGDAQRSIARPLSDRQAAVPHWPYTAARRGVAGVSAPSATRPAEWDQWKSVRDLA
jgi:hypothetical protein